MKAVPNAKLGGFFVMETKIYKNGKITIKLKNKGSIWIYDIDKIGGYISRIYIYPKYQNKGCGTELLNKAVELFKASGCESVRLHVSCENSGAIRLYKKQGFFIIVKVSKKKNPHYLMAMQLK